MKRRPTRQAWRVGLTLVLAVELSGCLSVRTTRTKSAEPAAAEGTLDVAVYDTPAKAKAGIPTPGSVSLDLNRLEKGQPETPVRSSSESLASFGSLAPGQYRLHLKAEAPASGSSADAPTITQESIKIAAGETVRTRVILKEFPYRAVIGGVLCIGAGIGIAYAVANSMWSGFGNSRLNRSSATRAVKARKK